MYRATAPADGTTGATSRWATREIAALDFLTSIPLESEEAIVRAGLSNTGAGGGGAVAAADGVGADGSISLAGIGSLDHVGGQPHGSSAGAGGAGPRWWERVVNNKGEIGATGRDHFAARRARLELEEKELERPSEEHTDTSAPTPDGPPADVGQRSVLHPTPSQQAQATPATAPRVAPGRRLEGRDATVVKIPRDVLTAEMLISHRTGVARQAAVREWEIRTAHGLPSASERASNRYGEDEDYDEHPGLLDGRIFLSASASYPAGVFSVIKYEPRREEARSRRKKLEERGGGGTQFVMPERDWRGISYRALLPRVHKKNHGFRRTLRERRRSNRKEAFRRMSDGEQPSVAAADRSSDDESSIDHDDDTISMSSSSSDDSDGYFPGFVDDPEMVQGRHRHVMVGDRATGCVVSSTIQFVQPSQLKADLNKQFKERFDGWEPAKEQRKYIGAKVIDGVYTLSDTTEFLSKDGLQRKKSDDDAGESRRRKGSTSTEVDTIRMPPSLTLSKIRRLKQQALIACVRAKMEVSTVALACVYFERLALDCRVDKSNRRLVFAACLLLAAKMNERNSHIVHGQTREVSGQREETKKSKILPSFIKPTEAGKNQFASLLDFFAHNWEISLKSLFAAEFGVFAALGFNLQAEPSHVAFHFKRFMKTLEWNSVAYLGQEQYNQWQRSLDDEEVRTDAHLRRKHMRREQEDRKLLDLQRDYHKQQQEEERVRRRGSPSYNSDSDSTSSRKNDEVAVQVAGSSGFVSSQEQEDITVPSNPTTTTGKPAKARGALRRPSAGTMKSFIPALRRVGGASKQAGSVASVEHLDKLAYTSHDVAGGISGTTKASSMRRSRSTPSMRNLEASANPNIAIDINPSTAVGMERISEVKSFGRGDGNDEEQEGEYSFGGSMA